MFADNNHSSTTVYWNIFILVALHPEYSVTQSQSCDNGNDNVAVVGHDEHHGRNMKERVDKDVEESEEMLAAWLWLLVILVFAHDGIPLLDE